MRALFFGRVLTSLAFNIIYSLSSGHVIINFSSFSSTLSFRQFSQKVWPHDASNLGGLDSVNYLSQAGQLSYLSMIKLILAFLRQYYERKQMREVRIK